MTSEYVPTTDEVRHIVDSYYGPLHHGAFDRWLAEHDAQLIEGLAEDMNRLSGGRQELWLFEQAQARRRQARRERA